MSFVSLLLLFWIIYQYFVSKMLGNFTFLYITISNLTHGWTTQYTTEGTKAQQLCS